MMPPVNRRQFLQAGAAVTATAFGFRLEAASAVARELKIARTNQVQSVCPYCAVGCGVVIHTTGERVKNARPTVVHIEGDPDNPVNRGTLCPKGAGLLDMVKSEDRLKHPEVREAGTNEWKKISWDDAFTRIAKHMKTDRDANFVAQNKDGLTVNRWSTMGFLASSAASNETGYLTHKFLRALGNIAFDTQARI